jgi:hypothetical protein
MLRFPRLTVSLSGLVALLFPLLVACSDSSSSGGAVTYSIGGTVTGLTGTLTLQNNGTDSITITADGAFAFTGRLADAATYDVTVSSPPVGQSCTVTNGAGTIHGADVTDIQVVCAPLSGWDHPDDPSDGITTAGGFPNLPRVDMGTNGDAAIVYYDEDGSGDPVILLSERRNGTWSHPASVNDKLSLDGTDVQEYSWSAPDVVMSNDGDTIVTWFQENSFSSDSFFVSERRNGVWTHPANPDDHHNIDGSIGLGDTRIGLAMASNGDTVICWVQNIPSGPQRVFLSEYRSGVWTHPASTADYISPDTWGNHEPHAAMSTNGDTILTWVQRRLSGSSDRNILVSTYEGSAWTHPADADSYISPDGVASWPWVAIGDNGDCAVVWRQATTGDIYDPQNKIFLSEYRGGVWTHPGTLADFICLPGTSTPASSPQVAMDASGNTVVVWLQYDGTYTRVFMSEYRSGAWTHPATIGDYINPDGSRASDPQVVMSASGDAVVIWEQSNGSEDQIYMSEYRNGLWTHPADLTDHISLDGMEAYEAHLAIDDDGDTLVVWLQANLLFMSEYTK